MCVVVSGVDYNENSMLNMAVDAARTRWVFTGLDAGAGEILGDDALGYMRKAVEKAKGEDDHGSVFWMPSFKVDAGAVRSGFGVEDLRR